MFFERADDRLVPDSAFPVEHHFASFMCSGSEQTGPSRTQITDFELRWRTWQDLRRKPAYVVCHRPSKPCPYKQT
jgi:hypothetical protein